MVLILGLMAVLQGDLRKQADDYLSKKEYSKAVEAYEKILQEQPDDVNALYNLACAHALAGSKDKAVEQLQKAVDAGFTDFEHIKTDSDLDSIRDTDGYKKILDSRAAAEKSAFDKRLKTYKEKLGDSYRELRDDARKIVLLTDLDEAKAKQNLGILGRFQDSLYSILFDKPPTYELLVLIPTRTEEYQSKLGGRQGAAGFYTPATKTLTVNLKTGGGTMIHEWTHAMHFADQAGRGQRHPLWVIEGLGSLYEQAGLFDERPIGYTNWRLKGIQGAIQQKKTYPMKEFIKNSDKYFRENAGLSYAQTRYIFYWLQEKRLLRTFYKEYVKTFDRDRTGLAAFEKVIDKPLDEWTAEWEKFVLGLTFQGMGSTELPQIGLRMDKALKLLDDAGDLKKDDQIRKVDGKAVSTWPEFHLAMERKNKGDQVTITVSRDDKSEDVKLVLK